ncbi:hypothetical protein [Streptomyces sp. NPDC053755]|uniref:hypothetical protein n=1 Tax=Streptomyces sp. NPDC053755 TaxID=3155815 RepID=UPI003448981F
MTFRYRRVLRSCCALLAGGLILTGCATDGGNERSDGRPDPSTAATPSGEPAPSPTPTRLGFTADPARAPKTTADAKRLALAVVAGPDSWGPDFVERTPYLSTDDHWPVLGRGCVWEAGVRPSTVLYSVTASSEIPAGSGRGQLRVSSTVTVHRTETAADWEMAETLEEALRCPEQGLRDGERITKLISIGNPFGVGGNFTASDSLGEMGRYHNDAAKDGPNGQKYAWYQSRVGQVTVAAVVKGAPGHTDKEIDSAQVQALVAMIGRAEKLLEAQS